MVDGFKNGPRAGFKRFADGCLAPSTEANRRGAFRSGQPVQQLRLARFLESAQPGTEHEPTRQLPRHSVYDELERLPNLTRATIGRMPLR